MPKLKGARPSLGMIDSMGAGTFEDFILDTTKHSTLPSHEEVERAFAQHDMRLVGPPLI